MVNIEIWVQKTGTFKNHFYVEKKYISLVFFGGLFRWKKFHVWTVYNHDFIEREN